MHVLPGNAPSRERLREDAEQSLAGKSVLSPKQYVADLTRNSTAITAINDEFRFFADDLHIWSFYETLKTRAGTNSVLLVERDSAIIGTPLLSDSCFQSLRIRA